MTNANKTFPLLLLFAAFIVITIARVMLVPPIEFLDGDDAAIAAGVARLCARKDIGPYFFHPPTLNKSESQALRMAIDGNGDTPVPDRFRTPGDRPFYRFDSMTGVYMLGSLSCGWGSPAARMFVLVFLFGTVFPISLAIFLYRWLQPLPPLVLPLCYACIALSPEVWISGTAYLNDKIFAVLFLALGLLVLTYVQLAKGVRSLLLWGAAGFLFGLAVLMRIDSILFVPAIVILVYSIVRDSMDRNAVKPAIQVSLLGLTAAATYVCGMQYMHASIRDALDVGIDVGLRSDWALEAWRLRAEVIPIAFGWSQTAAVFVSVVLGGAGIIWRLRTRQHDRGQRSGWGLRQQRIAAAQWTGWEKIAIVGSVILGESVILFLLGGNTPKYMLFSSALIAGLSIALPVLLFQNLKTDRPSALSGRRGTTVLALAAVLVSLGFGVFKGPETLTSDGPRLRTGWLLQELRPDAGSIVGKELISCLESNPDLVHGAILVRATSWILEETIAYEAASRGWQNEVIPLRASAIPRHGEAQERLFFTMNRYLIPNSQSSGLYVTSDWDTIYYGKKLTDTVFEKALGRDYVPYEELGSCFP